MYLKLVRSLRGRYFDFSIEKRGAKRKFESIGGRLIDRAEQVKGRFSFECVALAPSFHFPLTLNIRETFPKFFFLLPRVRLLCPVTFEVEGGKKQPW